MKISSADRWGIDYLVVRFVCMYIYLSPGLPKVGLSKYKVQLFQQRRSEKLFSLVQKATFGRLGVAHLMVLDVLKDVSTVRFSCRGVVRGRGGR